MESRFRRTEGYSGPGYLCQGAKTFQASVQPVATGTSPVLRGHIAENKGAGIIDALKARAEKKKVTFILETRVTELITNESSEIVGLKAIDKAGQEVSYETKAVVLATGGFDKNEALIDSYAPVAKGQTTFSSEDRKSVV